MARRLLSATFLSAALLVSGCATRSADAGDDRRQGGDATVINESVLGSAGGNVLNVLPSHVAGMRVRRTDGGCPEITLRGTRSILNSNNPVVYVDGTRTGNTCVLDTLVPSDVSRIEVYPMGVTSRPGYRSNPNGLILVFMKTTH